LPDPYVHVHSARAASLRPSLQPDFLKKGLHLHCDTADIGPGNARRWVEVNPQLVRMIEIIGANRMRVELDAAEVHDPCEAGGIIDHQLFRSAP
jgi:hypothetical protein